MTSEIPLTPIDELRSFRLKATALFAVAVAFLWLAFYIGTTWTAQSGFPACTGCGGIPAMVVVTVSPPYGAAFSVIEHNGSLVFDGTAFGNSSSVNVVPISLTRADPLNATVAFTLWFWQTEPFFLCSWVTPSSVSADTSSGLVKVPAFGSVTLILYLVINPVYAHSPDPASEYGNGWWAGEVAGPHVLGFSFHATFGEAKP